MASSTLQSICDKESRASQLAAFITESALEAEAKALELSATERSQLLDVLAKDVPWTTELCASIKDALSRKSYRMLFMALARSAASGPGGVVKKEKEKGKEIREKEKEREKEAKEKEKEREREAKEREKEKEKEASHREKESKDRERDKEPNHKEREHKDTNAKEIKEKEKEKEKEREKDKANEKEKEKDKERERGDGPLEVVVLGAGWAGSCVAAALSSLGPSVGLNVTHVDARGMLTDSLQLIASLTSPLSNPKPYESHSLPLSSIALGATHFALEATAVSATHVTLDSGHKVRWDYLVVCTGARFDSDLLVKAYSETLRSNEWYAQLYLQVRSEPIICDRFMSLLRSRFVEGNALFIDDVDKFFLIAESLLALERPSPPSSPPPSPSPSSPLSSSPSLSSPLLPLTPMSDTERFAALDRFKGLPALDDVSALKSELRTLSERLLSDYLTPGSQHELNLPGSVRKPIVSALKGSDLSSQLSLLSPQRSATVKLLAPILRDFLTSERKRARLAPFFLPALWPGRAMKTLSEAEEVTLFGNGALAVYAASELKGSHGLSSAPSAQTLSRKVKLLHAQQRLVEQLPVSASSFIETLLDKAGVHCANTGVANVAGIELEEPPKIRMKDGSAMDVPALLVLGASVPNTEALRATFASALDEDARLRVNDFLQVVAPNSSSSSDTAEIMDTPSALAVPLALSPVSGGRVFACGAACSMSVSALSALDWRASSSQASVLVHNLLRSVRNGGTKLRSYKPLAPVDDWIPVDSASAVTRSQRGDWVVRPHVHVDDDLSARVRVFVDECSKDKWRESPPKFSESSVPSLLSDSHGSGGSSASSGGGTGGGGKEGHERRPSLSLLSTMASPFKKKKDKERKSSGGSGSRPRVNSSGPPASSAPSSSQASSVPIPSLAQSSPLATSSPGQ